MFNNDCFLCRDHGKCFRKKKSMSLRKTLCIYFRSLHHNYLHMFHHNLHYNLLYRLYNHLLNHYCLNMVRQFRKK